uniref:Small integral membrane protein 20 isoform X3 n=1 Tax=Geotrypetes seraphini TaxID=260995 RepID=A0A6P8RJS1_GEOSA|nr:small integral membrane protein 20 isoform X3 [Geotrypetes seraphini]
MLHSSHGRTGLQGWSETEKVLTRPNSSRRNSYRHQQNTHRKRKQTRKQSSIGQSQYIIHSSPRESTTTTNQRLVYRERTNRKSIWHYSRKCSATRLESVV